LEINSAQEEKVCFIRTEITTILILHLKIQKT